jgi:membrane-bound lytic murein transglycosylase B
MSLHFDGLRRKVPGREIAKRKIKVNKTLASVFMIAMVAMSILPFKAQADNSVSLNQVKIGLSTGNFSPVIGNPVNPVVITPGESQVQKEARLQAEAEAAAQAAAKATALAKAKKAAVKVVAVATFNDPSDFESIYERAGAMFGVDPKLLHAIHIVETGASGSTYRANASGAAGPMQFLPSTFRAHAVDGDGDGVTNIADVQDAIFTAANYLRACGYPDVRKALWGYNPSTSYYNHVMSVMNSL